MSPICKSPISNIRSKKIKEKKGRSIRVYDHRAKKKKRVTKLWMSSVFSMTLEKRASGWDITMYNLEYIHCVVEAREIERWPFAYEVIVGLGQCEVSALWVKKVGGRHSGRARWVPKLVITLICCDLLALLLLVHIAS